MDGQVMCPKCKSTTDLSVFDAGLLDVSVRYVPPAETRAPKVAPAPPTPSKTAKRPEYKEEIKFANNLFKLSSLIFYLIVISGAISGMLGGYQSGAGIAMIIGAIIGALISILPAYLSASTFRFFGYTLRLLIDISRK